jgi:hypothetical protein
MVGLSDGTYSEVLSGDIQPGQDVLIGTFSGAPSRSSSSGGPRLRL